ncbi:MAG TPA: cyclase family protein, partial [Candidatus Sulfotelmatobacter sp.]|nr:cyclase family protein [Candidatus Sulfotelmatobacter sp.]
FWHIENLTQLDRLPARFAFVAFPVKFQGASASPLRVVALPGQERPPQGRFVDLSHEVVAEFTRGAYSKSKRSAVLRWHNIMETKIQETKLLLFSDHASTHIDAPNHFNPKGKTIDQMPLELVTGVPASWLDLSHKKHRESVGPDDLAKAAERAGMRRGDVVLIYTGISRLWNGPDYWRSVIPITPEAVRWLLERDVKVFGADQDEIDGDVLTWPAHRLMREHEFYIIENVNLWPAVLDLPHRFTFYGLPLPLDGATAAPVRAVAQLNAA